MTVSEGVVRDLIREDGQKIQTIMQFLKSRGLVKTLAQLEEESELSFFQHCLTEGAVLDEALDSFWSRATTPELFQSVEEIVQSDGLCITQVTQVISEIHGASNPTTVSWHPTLQHIVATGAVDRRVVLRDINKDKGILGEVCVASPVLSSQWTEKGLFIGCMGGELYGISFKQDFSEIHSSLLGKPHGSKRITSVVASPDGGLIATVAKDACIHLICDGSKVGPIRCERDVASVCWIDTRALVVAEIDNPILTVWTLNQEGSKWERTSHICMNLSPADPRNPYTTFAMAWNPEHRLLAACTNRNSALIFSLPVSSPNLTCPIKTLYGMSIGALDIPFIDFSLDGSHLYVSSDRRILVFEVRSGHNVFDVPVSESKNVRCMRRSRVSDILATVSFDRQLSILA